MALKAMHNSGCFRLSCLINLFDAASTADRLPVLQGAAIAIFIIGDPVGHFLNNSQIDKPLRKGIFTQRDNHWTGCLTF